MQLICNCQAIRRRLRYKFNNVDLLSFFIPSFPYGVKVLLKKLSILLETLIKFYKYACIFEKSMV